MTNSNEKLTLKQTQTILAALRKYLETTSEGQERQFFTEQEPMTDEEMEELYDLINDGNLGLEFVPVPPAQIKPNPMPLWFRNGRVSNR